MRNQILYSKDVKGEYMNKENHKFHLTDLPNDKFCVLLKQNVPKQLINLAADKFTDSNKQHSKYKLLAKHLQKNCESLSGIKLKSINPTYLSAWKYRKKFIPLDCAIELYKILNKNSDDLENDIESIKHKILHNKKALAFSSFTNLFESNKEFLKRIKNEKTSFVDYFFGMNLTSSDIEDLKNFTRVIGLRIRGMNNEEISKIIQKPKRKIDYWIFEESPPMPIRLMKKFMDLGKPKDGKWLSINSTRGGLFKGPWIVIPEKIRNYEDILSVIRQIEPFPKFYERVKKFNITSGSIEKLRPLLFAYLLGMIIGDCGKQGIKRKQKITRRIKLNLSTKFQTNERLGEFTALCANSLGLRMDRCKNMPKGKKNIYPFYTWISQSSQLIQWIFNICLGLKDSETTTYTSIRADWILDAPREFKIWFIQGVADSDGYVDINLFRAGIVTKPNRNFIETILKSLGTNPLKGFLHKGNLGVITINLEEAFLLPIFNPIVDSYRYQLMSKLVNGQQFHKWPKWLDKEVKRLLNKNLKPSEIIKEILYRYNVRVSMKGINNRRSKHDKIN